MSEQVPLPIAGWFPDPELADKQRYWDGTHWTEHRAPALLPYSAKAVKETKRAEKSIKPAKVPRGVDLSVSDEEYQSRVAESLQRAVDAARQSSVDAEETATRLAYLYAKNTRGTEGLKEVEREVRSMRSAKLLLSRQLMGIVKPESLPEYMARTGKFMGRVASDPIEIYGDRIIQGTKTRAMDAYTQAQVFLDGQMQITQRPSLGMMALISPLPGSALIPGLAFQKKEKNDSRVAEFQVGGRDWSMTVRVNPLALSQPRSFAEQINRTGESLAVPAANALPAFALTPAVSAPAAIPAPLDTLSQLERIAALRAAGAITEDEAAALKQKVLAGGAF